MKRSTVWLGFIVLIGGLWGGWAYSIHGVSGLGLFFMGMVVGDQVTDYWANYKKAKKSESTWDGSGAPDDL